MKQYWHAMILLCVAVAGALADDVSERILGSIDRKKELYEGAARQIWEWSEAGYKEGLSSGLLQQQLRDAGFKVEAGVAGMPTAFVASYGKGSPVVAFLAEFDALPGFSQDALPEKKEILGRTAGHGCGHNLLGEAACAAGIAVREWMESEKIPGTMRVYGAPAEEGGGGKVYMVRAGLFRDVDAVLHWHPSSVNVAGASSTLGSKSAKFRFYGVSAHAASAPSKGRSALDGVEAMDHMVNLMREHVPQEARIHYVITSGGASANVVPDFAEVYYSVRHPEATGVSDIFDRVVKASEGAAMGTGTSVKHEVINAVYPVLPNAALGRLIGVHLQEVGGVEYSPEEATFASTIQKTLSLSSPPPPLSVAKSIKIDETISFIYASTDVGDVSWVVPTAGFATASWVPGTAAHSWQAVAASGMSIGFKGMTVAAKTMALSAADLFSNRQALDEIRAEYRRRVGPGFEYKPLVGDRQPPLDYGDGPSRN